MVGERRHPLLAQTPTAPAAHAPSSAHRQHVVAVPSAGVPGVGVRLMQEPGFAAHDSHLYARGRDQPGRPQDVQLAGRRQEEARRQRALSPGSQHSAAATFFAR
ncbi:uncharacterized protein LOC135104287 [Scylla paramamosain]|uniref:uncharacterized protein LOC135104287 n=1 Tax=Scylla paramamosain TaxID=85552 RepID=UPI003082FA6F